MGSLVVVYLVRSLPLPNLEFLGILPPGIGPIVVGRSPDITGTGAFLDSQPANELPWTAC